MPTLTQVRTRVDNWITSKWPTIVARQQNFFANRGRYWQGLITHNTIPEFTSSQDGDALADRLNQSLHDQFENWSTVFPEWISELLPCAIKCDVYQATEGHGYVVTVHFSHNGVLYSKAQNVGPHFERSNGWKVDEISTE